jgi:hypothetical protein
MKFFFETTRPEVPNMASFKAYSLHAKNLSEAGRLFQAFLVGLNDRADPEWEMTSATAYKRRGIEYMELEL